MAVTIAKLNIICYSICIICIVAGVLFALYIIWGDVESRMAWKGFLTIAVFFLGSALTLSVNKMMTRTPARSLE